MKIGLFYIVIFIEIYYKGIFFLAYLPLLYTGVYITLVLFHKQSYNYLRQKGLTESIKTPKQFLIQNRFQQLQGVKWETVSWCLSIQAILNFIIKVLVFEMMKKEKGKEKVRKG